MKCRKGKHVCFIRKDRFCHVTGSAAGAPQVMNPEYECVDMALPKRRFEVHDKAGNLRKMGVDAKTGVDKNPLTKLYPRVNAKGQPVFHNRRELQRFFSHDIVKENGYVYDR